MLGTYASALLVLAAAAAVGQAVFRLCGRERWSWLAPAVGLAALLPVAWWSVRLPGEGTAAAIVLGALAASAAVYLRGRTLGLADALRAGAPIAALALLVASLPFLVEGRFGILGTGLNPDMSQHLFAADRLAESGSERLIASGYPLGPHAFAVALSAPGPSLVQAFGGLTIATALATALAPLGLLGRLAGWRRLAVALLVGFAYMTASYLTQGAFKETLQALFLLAFALGLGQLARGRLAAPGLRRAVPLAVLAVGSAYAYSFPGLVWLIGAAGAWALMELILAARGGTWRARALAIRAIRPALVAGAVLGAALAPELTRMADFARFETFDPDGAGLGNLFNRISPLEALGIWPSGDFRVEAGDGFAPPLAFWAGAVIAVAALAFGIWWWLGRGELAVPVTLATAGALVAYANLAGTPYQEAKAIALAAPLAMLVSARALAVAAPSARQVARIVRRRGIATLLPRSARLARARLAVAALAAAFAAAAGLSSVLALANGPVGPARWSPALLERKPLPGPTLVLAPEEFLVGEHGRDFVVWELRGGEVCVEIDPGPSPGPPPPGVAQVIVYGHSTRAPFEGADAGSAAGAFTLWGVDDPAPGDSGCPFIADGARADPSG
ncbi:MAG: hypothetical protein ACR2G3_00585 [Solirubrobacterales bacterium]